MVITSTSVIPRNMNSRRPLLLVAKVPAGSSVAVRYNCDGEWITSEAFTSDFVRQLECYKCEVSILLTGTAKVHVHGLEA